MTRTVPIAAPSLGEEEWLALREPLESGWLTQGPKVAEFERAFAQRHDVPHALATTSCTTALHLALIALGVGEGDEVIVPAFTWVASANAARYVGATPVFVDVDPATYNIDPARVAAAVGERTHAVVAVHLFGLCADVDALRSVIPDRVALLEDAACAAGAAYRGRPAGSLGEAAAFSFHPRKSITTGEGGMVTTADARIAEHANRLRNHGAGVSEEARHAGPAPWLMPTFDELGFNYRMTDLQAAVGVEQLRKLDGFVAERDRWARWYSDQLGELGWLTPPVTPSGYDHSWQAYVAVVAEDAPMARDEVMRELHGRGVATRPGTHCVPALGLYRKSSNLADYPVALELEARSLALPLHNRMTQEDYEYVVRCLREL